MMFLFFKQKTAYEMRISDWSSDVCSSDLTELNVGSTFNRNIDHLPCSLKVLKLGWNFNQNVDHLPPRLSRLVFGYWFDKPVDNLPESLRHLEIGRASCRERVCQYV